MPEIQSQRGKRKERTGVVIKDAMDKTIVVRVERRVRHPVYGKVMRQYTRCYAHDGEDKARVGDWVRIEETRPLSRLKRWRLVEIVKVHLADTESGLAGAPAERAAAPGPLTE